MKITLLLTSHSDLAKKDDSKIVTIENFNENTKLKDLYDAAAKRATMPAFEKCAFKFGRTVFAGNKNILPDHSLATSPKQVELNDNTKVNELIRASEAGVELDEKGEPMALLVTLVY